MDGRIKAACLFIEQLAASYVASGPGLPTSNEFTDPWTPVFDLWVQPKALKGPVWTLDGAKNQRDIQPI
jgi:hypothetical protein